MRTFCDICKRHVRSVGRVLKMRLGKGYNQKYACAYCMTFKR